MDRGPVRRTIGHAFSGIGLLILLAGLVALTAKLQECTR